MEDLRERFEALGLSNITTFIASGNVVFETRASNARALEKRIERQLQEWLGYAVATFIRSSSELSAIAAYQPYPIRDLEVAGNSLYIALLPAPPGSEVQQKLLSFRTAVDDFRIHEREIYWLSRGKMSESAFSGALLEKTIRMPATIRNVNTLRRLAAKYGTSQ